MKLSILRAFVALFVCIAASPSAESKSSESKSATPQQQAQHPAVEKATKYLEAENYEKAFEAALIAAKEGDTEAKVALGCLYFEGKGISKDCTEAVRYFKLAADQGHASAEAAFDELRMMYIKSND